MSRISTKIVVSRRLAKRAVEDFRRALGITLKQFVIGLDHTARRIEQALAAGVLANIGQQRLRRRLSLVP